MPTVTTAVDAFDRRLAQKLADSCMLAMNECRKSYPYFTFDVWAEDSQAMPGRVEATVLVETRRSGPPFGEHCVYTSGTPTAEIVMGIHAQCVRLQEAVAREDAERRREPQASLVSDSQA